MDKQEAASLLEAYLQPIDATPYPELAKRVGESHVKELMCDSGAWYTVDVKIMWDNKPNGAIRVLASIDDGGLTAIFPLTRDRLIHPNNP